MVERSHTAFPQLDDHVPLWRYTNLAKLVWALSQNALWLSRGDLLGDAFEGSIPQRDHTELIERLVRLNTERLGSEAEAKRFVFDEFLPLMAVERRTYLLSMQVNCWSAAAESEAMWRFYCRSSDGVAMVTTFGKLKASLTDPDIWLGKVRYVDYGKDQLSGNDLLQPITHKRVAFEHEKEVRIVRWRREEMEGEWTSKDGAVEPRSGPGRKMEWHAQNTLDRVVVSPYSPEWYFDAVKDVVVNFEPALADHLEWSELRADPIF